MVVLHCGAQGPAQKTLFDAMFEDRKRLFVDLLGWNVPTIAGRFEMDVFDNDDALYLIDIDGTGTHAGSMRLLPSTMPHILSELFASLCEGEVPSDPSTFEITRLCLPARHPARNRLFIRNRLISAMVDHALGNGIDRLTGVVTAGFRDKVLAMGWQARSLGPAKTIGGAMLGAFEIRLSSRTPDLLASTGIYLPGTLQARLSEQAAA